MALTTTILRFACRSRISFAAFPIRSDEPTHVPPNLGAAASISENITHARQPRNQQNGLGRRGAYL